MGDNHRNTSRDFSAPAARGGGEASPAPATGFGPARPGLPQPRANLEPGAFDIDRELGAGGSGYLPGRGLYIDEFRVPTSLRAEMAADRAAAPPRPRRFGLLRLLTSVVVAAVAAATTVLLAPKFLSSPVQKAAVESTDTAAPVDRPAAVPETPPSAPSPRLASVEAVTQDIDEPVSLNLSLQGRADGDHLIMRGLVAGSVVAAGRPLGEGAWRVDVGHIQDVRVRPPRAFVGAMDLVVELRLADDTIADRRSVRLEWAGVKRLTALAPAETQNPAAEPGSSDPRGPMRPDERQAIAPQVARGKELLRNGDFSSARLILLRAAEAGDADAALTLGATYDPTVLARLGIRNQVANVELARMWYQKAQENGSTEASSRLQRLTSSGR
jgi:hypothetical protein